MTEIEKEIRKLFSFTTVPVNSWWIEQIKSLVAAARRQAEEERDAWKDVALCYGSYESNGDQIASEKEAEEFFVRILAERKEKKR